MCKFKMNYESGYLKVPEWNSEAGNNPPPISIPLTSVTLVRFFLFITSSRDTRWHLYCILVPVALLFLQNGSVHWFVTNILKCFHSHKCYGPTLRCFITITEIVLLCYFDKTPSNFVSFMKQNCHLHDAIEIKSNRIR